VRSPKTEEKGETLLGRLNFVGTVAGVDGWNEQKEEMGKEASIPKTLIENLTFWRSRKQQMARKKGDGEGKEGGKKVLGGGGGRGGYATKREKE